VFFNDFGHYFIAEIMAGAYGTLMFRGTLGENTSIETFDQ